MAYRVTSSKQNPKTLSEEMNKYHSNHQKGVKDIEYFREVLDTSEIDELFKLMEIYSDCIDKVILCKEERSDTTFNISYTAIILVSHTYLSPIAYMNINGFAWNFEKKYRYKKMIEFLESEDIYYEEKELQINDKISNYYDDDLLKKLLG